MTNVVENIGLEALMDRANIIFTNGYAFNGILNLEQLKKSFDTIFNAVTKFEYQLSYTSQSHFSWNACDKRPKLFHHQICDDLEFSFKKLSSESIALIGNAPMNMTVLENKESSEFILAISNNHTYQDARSANYVFNQIITHYNASIKNDSKLSDSAVSNITALKTISGIQFIEEVLALKSDIDNNKNIAGLLDYAIEDVGQYGINRSELTDCMSQYNKTVREPQISQLDVNKCIDQCRKISPEVTKNSIVCAMLAKSVYLVNIEQRNKSKKHKVSFKMLSDLLSPQQRKRYTGNYISFLPVTVDADKSLPEIALQIHNRVIEFKTQSIDISMFSLTEQAIEQELVGTADEALSFVVTNWNNFDYLNSDKFLHNCTSKKHLSAVNIEPKDTLGAALVNRPVAVINFSPNSELCLSFFPSLRSPQENKDLLAKFKLILNSDN